MRKDIWTVAFLGGVAIGVLGVMDGNAWTVALGAVIVFVGLIVSQEAA